MDQLLLHKFVLLNLYNLAMRKNKVNNGYKKLHSKVEVSQFPNNANEPILLMNFRQLACVQILNHVWSLKSGCPRAITGGAIV